MTTKVFVAVEETASENVKVEIQARNADGSFAQGGEQVLKPGEMRAFYVHAHQSLQVIEE